MIGEYYYLITFATLRDYALIERLLSAGLLLLDTSVLVGELVVINATCDLLQHGSLPLLARQSSAEEFCRSGNDLADLGVFGGARAEGLLLVLGVQNASHTEGLPFPLELRGHVRLGKIEPVGTCGRLLQTC